MTYSVHEINLENGFKGYDAMTHIVEKRRKQTKEIQIGERERNNWWKPCKRRGERQVPSGTSSLLPFHWLKPSHSQLFSPLCPHLSSPPLHSSLLPSFSLFTLFICKWRTIQKIKIQQRYVLHLQFCPHIYSKITPHSLLKLWTNIKEGKWKVENITYEN